MSIGRINPSGKSSTQDPLRTVQRWDRVRTAAGTAAIIAAAAALLAAPAQASFDILKFDGGLFDQGGSSVTQAGSHPYAMVTDVQFTSLGVVDGQLQPDGQVKTLQVDLPPGLVGNPTGTPTKCTTDLLFNNVNTSYDCPNSSQIGTVDVYYAGFLPNTILPPDPVALPLYNMEPPPGKPADFAFAPLGVPVHLIPSVRTGGDYGITVTGSDLSQQLGVVGGKVTLWGVPADSSHDAARICPGVPISGSDPSPVGCSTDAGPTAFITMRSNCSSGPAPTTLHAAPWHAPADFRIRSFSQDTNGAATAVTGCERVPFEPRVSVQPTTNLPDSPTGLAIDLTMPTEGLDSPSGLAQAPLRRAVVTLPEGMTVSPSAADGLKSCAPPQVGLANDAVPSCPAQSKIGTVEIDTPLLDRPLQGGIYLASQQDNPFGSLLAMYLVAEGPGVVVKLAGRVTLDQTTGRLSTSFDNAPQFPFSSLRVRLDSGPRAPLATPTDCGPKTVTADLTSWTGQSSATLADSFSIVCPGMSGFAPAVTANLTQPLGGTFSPFALRVQRPDAQEFLDGLAVDLPSGLLAKIRGVQLCGTASASTGTCPESSRIGTITVGAGPGPHPFFLKGSVSLTEGYKGGEYGLSIAVPAIAGPLNLGVVTVLAAVFVDRGDAHVRVVSDPIPTILQGIPLRLRTMQVDVDRPRFMKAPTSCSEKSVVAVLHSQQGTSVRVPVAFRVGGCKGLAVTPRMSLGLTGRRQTRVGRHPGLEVTVSQPAGQANLKRVSVKLPLTLALDPANARGLCEYEAGQRVACPASSVIGSARAISPLLNKPLTGSVYFVKGIRFGPNGRVIRTLPTLLLPLRGEIGVDLRGKSTVDGGRLVSTFSNIPDATISRVDLSLRGGKGGILAVTNHSLCGRKQIADAEIDGHNGKRADRPIAMHTPCTAARQHAQTTRGFPVKLGRSPRPQHALLGDARSASQR